MTDKIYVVIVQPKAGHVVAAVSSEGYSTVEDATAFILGRSDNPSLYENWIYEGDNNIYSIKEITIKG